MTVPARAGARDPLAGRRRVVVGGAGAVGRMFTRLFLDRAAAVCAVDLTPAPAEFGGERYQFVCGDIDTADTTGTAGTAGGRLAAEIGQADVVLLALPEAAALAAAPRVAGLMRPGALLADTLSVKTRIVDALRAATRDAGPGRGVEAVSLNPMFAPSLGMRGRPVAAVVVRGGPRTRELLGDLEGGGARVVPMSAAEHDRLTAATQALTHAAVLGFGLALAELDVDVAALTAIAPPPHLTMLALLARILSGSAETYWDIQAGNPWAADARAALAAGVRDVGALTGTDFARALDRLRERFGADLEHHADRCAHLFDALSGHGHTGGTA